MAKRLTGTVAWSAILSDASAPRERRPRSCGARGTFGLRLAEDEADAVAIALNMLRERDHAAKVEAAAAL